MSTTEIVAARPTALVPTEPAEAALMMRAYRELCESILDDDDVIGIPGTPGGFVKRSGWQKLATFYRVSTTIVYNATDHDEEGTPVRARAIVRATHESGRSAEGDGACAITEPRFKGRGRQKAEHDIGATAVTRATNRAISNLIGFGSVSAEEVDGDGSTGAGPEFGPAASPAEEDGMLRALEDLGALVAPAKRLAERAGYLPKIGALAIMYVAAAVKAEADTVSVEEAGPAPDADDVPWDDPAPTEVEGDA
jgi:hypothetical protein